MRRERHSLGLRRVTAHAHPLLPALEHGGERGAVDAGSIERRLGKVAGAQQSQEEVLGADELVAEPLGFGARVTQDALGALAQWLVRHWMAGGMR